MAREILSVPEEDLDVVIAVIRKGLEYLQVAKHVREALLTWCDEQEEYLERLEEE